MKRILKKCLKAGMLFCYRLMTFLPIKKNVIVFESNLGRNYTGNPRSIYEEMVRQGMDKKYRCYYILDQTDILLPGSIKTVRNSRFFYYYIMAVARVWVCDTRFPNYMIKRSGCSYIQTWHGTPLKKLALDMDDVKMAEESIEAYKENFRENTATWDYLISQNPFSTKTFKRCFDFHKTMLEIGYPRNDVLFRENNEADIIQIKKEYNIPLDKKVILYAPTWRDDAYYENGSYKFVTPLDFHKLKERFGTEYVILIKYHYMVRERIDWSIYDGFCIPFDNRYDIAKLYLASDILMTDYSSVMFDYSLLKRPMIFYAFDLEQYKDNLRGFYFNFIEEAPGTVCITNEEVIAAIEEVNQAAGIPRSCQKKYEEFVQKYNPFDDGHASEKVIQLIEKLVAEER